MEMESHTFTLVHTIVVKAALSSSNIIDQYVENLMDSMHLSKKIKYELIIILEETISNIVNYAYTNEDGDISLYFYISQEFNILKIKIVDTGKPFNPTLVKAPEKVSLVPFTPGGLGIFISKNLADDYSYQLKDGKNTLTIIKKIAS